MACWSKSTLAVDAAVVALAVVVLVGVVALEVVISWTHVLMFSRRRTRRQITLLSGGPLERVVWVWGRRRTRRGLREMLIWRRVLEEGRGERGSIGRCLYLCAINGFAVFCVAFSVLDR